MAIARAGSISAAATELSMSQSAASTALIELERRYDRSLFDRTGKRLKINETGRSLLVPALELLSRAEEIDGLLAGRAGPGPLHIGATQTIGNYIAPRLINAYSERYEGCALSLEISNTAAIAARIVDFSLDLALVEGAYAHPDLNVTDWLHDELILICAASHPLAGQQSWSIDDVLAERWVVREKGSGTRQTLDTAMRPFWSRWHIDFELQQIEAILEMVAVSSLIGCVPRVAAQQFVSQGRLAEIRIPALDLRRRFHIMTHKGKHFTAGIRAFLDICEGA